MIRYRVISEANNIVRRLKRNMYDRPWGDRNHTRDGDSLTLFTLKPQALCDSATNLDLVMSVARAYGQELVVVKPNMIQIAGRDRRCEAVADILFPQAWRREHQEWLDSTSPMIPRLDRNDRGEVCEFYTWRPALCVDQHQGVYDVATGDRLKNRRDIIERMWALGFAAQRGRPLSMARQRWTGSCEELDLITRLADQHWQRASGSEAAKKMVSTFRSINRYAAWPGAW